MKSFIEKNIHRFDFCTLQKYLKNLGYKSENIWFRSHISKIHPAQIFEEIKFHEKEKRVDVYVNWGIYSVLSLLDSKLQEKKAGELKLDEGLDKLVDVLDHFLIRTYLEKPYVEDVKVGNLPKISITYLQQIFRCNFPQLQVKVTKEKPEKMTVTRISLKTACSKKNKATYLPSFVINLSVKHKYDFFFEDGKLTNEFIEKQKNILFENIFPNFDDFSCYLRIYIHLSTVSLSHTNFLSENLSLRECIYNGPISS